MSCFLRRLRRLAAVAVALLGHLARLAVVECAEPPIGLTQRVSQWIVELRDDRFGVREEARRKLIQAATEPATRDETLRLLVPRSADAGLPFETREILRALVPPDFVPSDSARNPAAATIAIPTTAELEAWLNDLESASFADRERAAVRLTAAAEQRAGAGPLLWHLRKRFGSLRPTPDSLRRIRMIWETALRTWVTTEPPPWKPPLPTDDEIATAVARVAASPPRPEVGEWLQPGVVAERELRLFLSLDEAAPRVSDALKRKLDDPNLTPAAANRLDRLYVASRPAMAAEFWQAGRHHSTQHLLIGVPNQPEGAPRPSLFDRCDEKFAHCVSGNSLAPGDHPVGVFFPHPNDLQGNAQFHLVNLPSPRRRMAYEYEAPTQTASDAELAQIDERRRREITHRTTARLLAEKRPLAEREIDMLAQLDPVETARFAEKYLLTVADERYDSGSPQAFGNGSRHGWTCYILSTLGIPEAGRAVAAAIDKGRVLEPTEDKPYRIEWAAVLYLAESAPWPEVDGWLAAQLDRNEAMNVREPTAADVGASAAARLLLRAGRHPHEFELEQHEFPELIDLESPGYRFKTTEGRAAVKKWWREKQAADAKRNP